MDLLTRQHIGLNDPTLKALQMTTTKYFPLLRDREIRLVDIKPGSFSDVLSLRLYHGFLDQTMSRPFDALSYVWGSVIDPIEVLVEVIAPDSTSHHDVFFLGQNLAAALQHLRQVKCSRTIWADALCIHQTDYIERAKQVLIMGEIYSRARKVVAFLGPDNAKIKIGIELLQNIGSNVDVDFSSGIVRLSPIGSTQPEWADVQKALRVDKHEILSVYDLISYEWFERLWVRQEIGCGEREGILQCGHLQIRWPIFCNAIFVLFRKPLIVDGLDKTQRQRLRERLGLADTIAIYSKRNFRFSNLRRQLRTSKCADPRDRIYGVLSQLRDLDQLVITPDYTSSVAEVYTDVTRKYITEHRHKLLVLGQCEMKSSGRSLDIPTWVPDWSSHLQSSQIHAIVPPIFDLLPAMHSVDNKVLRAHGMHYDTVSQVVYAYEDPALDLGPIVIAVTVKKMITQAQAHAALFTRYGSREKLLEAYTRTIWVDNFGDRWLPLVPHEPFFQDCLSLLQALFQNDSIDESILCLDNAELSLTRVHEACASRSIFVTEKGLIGLAPAAVTPGDEICLLFSCSKPLVVRPTKEGPGAVRTRYQLTGECYLHEMMLGQALLGDLPDHLRGLLRADNPKGKPDGGFVDIQTGTLFKEDPRTQPFLERLVQDGLLTDPSLGELERKGAVEVLTAAGYDLRLYNLV
ncbi:heterokaryon incompatibility protein-domain-containing protein [Xylariaceae sp. FL0255]|nr:heterokaryon incompatibility protein-domain-containing protein [Xylariaceae sp. FL0255]